MTTMQTTEQKAPLVFMHTTSEHTCCLCEIQSPGSGCRLLRRRFPFSADRVHQSLNKKQQQQQINRCSPGHTRLDFNTTRCLARTNEAAGTLTCPWDNDDEAAAVGQLPDEVEVLAESGRVGHQVGRHGRLGLGLLKATL